MGKNHKTEVFTVLNNKRIRLWPRDRKFLKQSRKHTTKYMTEKLDYTQIKNPYIKA